uniref:Mitochondrial import receptor subunit TOM7 homolog n=1 Tax=Panagrellus redivivus TaxID=6233 RepID=A0A7E4V2I4_PANRE
MTATGLSKSIRVAIPEHPCSTYFNMSDFDSTPEKSLFDQTCSAGAEVLRLGLQYGFLPFVLYLGFQRGGETPTGERVELGFSSLFWG